MTTLSEQPLERLLEHFEPGVDLETIHAGFAAGEYSGDRLDAAVEILRRASRMRGEDMFSVEPPSPHVTFAPRQS